MKHLFLGFAFFCFSIIALAQSDASDKNLILESELKSAQKLMQFQPNVNTQNYDVLSHELRFSVDPSVYFISGTVTTTYKALSNLNTVIFDLADELSVSSVTQNGNPLSFSQSSDQLTITLASPQASGTENTIIIQYSGEPPVNGFEAFVVDTHNGTPVLWTLSEPYGARDWWPCKQDLNDKVDTVHTYITTPSQYTAVSNGLEQSQTISGSQKTTYFKHNYPIPAYLIAIAVTNYQTYTQQAGTAPNTFPIVNYFYPETASTNQSKVAVTLPIMNFYETTFETYPFHNEKYGHAQFSWGGGMEHTTVSFMGGFSRGLIAHELAHQWFGDKVTCGSWRDIWLNEGFATYLAAMVIEHFDGLEAFVAEKSMMIDNITSASDGAVYLTEQESLNANRIFSGRLSYNKGAMVLEMLRWKLGNTTFLQGIRNYLADNQLAYAYARTTDLKSHLEAVYNQSLTEFFNDWVYNQGFPTYDITIEPFNVNQVKIRVAQTQSHSSVSFFEMPIAIKLYGTEGQEQMVTLEHTSNNQEFIVSTTFPVVNAEFDPEKHIISNSNLVTLSNTNITHTTISIYPNPATTQLNIQIPEHITSGEVEIFNTLGQQEYHSNLQPQINISPLAPGIHILKIVTSNGTQNLKFVKK